MKDLVKNMLFVLALYDWPPPPPTHTLSEKYHKVIENQGKIFWWLNNDAMNLEE